MTAVTTMPPMDAGTVRQLYAAFNARDIDAVLARMDPDVDWPDMLENRRLIGHDAVRAYWLHQFELFDPWVEPQDPSNGPVGSWSSRSTKLFVTDRVRSFPIKWSSTSTRSATG
jgi:SnoaL-like domain